MKKFARILAIALVIVMALTTLVACPEPPVDGEKTKYTLTVWGAEEDQAMLKAMCDAYAKANPQNEYKFLFGVQSEADAADKVLNDVESGPDVYSFASDQINKLFAAGALARVGGEAERNVIANNTPGSIDAASFKINGEDQLWAYPMTGDNCYFVYYDKRVFTEESLLASLDSMLDTAAAAGKTVHFKLNDDGWYLSSFFFANPDLKYEVTYDDAMVEQSDSINFNEAGGLEAMKAIRNYVAHESLVVQPDDSKIIAAFTEGSAAAAVTGTWNRKAISDLLGENMGVCKLPTVMIAGEQTQLSGFMGYKLVGVNGFSKNKGEAHKLAEWLTNEQNQLIRFQQRGFGPTNKNLASLPEVLNDPVISVVLEQGQFNRPQKSVPGNYWTPMGSLITPLVTAKADGTYADITDEKLQEYLDALVDQIAK